MDTHRAVDELDVMGTLRVAIASAVGCTSRVGRILCLSTILGHLHEVKSAVETARKVGDIDVECELLVLQVEHLVVVRVLHEVDTGSDVFLA